MSDDTLHQEPADAQATTSPRRSSGPVGGDDEVSRRTRARKKRTVMRLVAWVVGALFVVALGAAGYTGWRYFDRTQAAEADLAHAAELLEAAERDVVAVDEAVQVEIASAVATDAVEAIALAGDVRGRLTEVVALIDDVRGRLPEERLGLADALRESAEARIEMMDIAPGILEGDRKAALAIPLADAAVVEIKLAEDQSAQAVVEFNKHTADGVRASDAHSVQAEAHLAAARAALTGATEAFPEADFTAFIGYIDAKLGLIALAKEIDALWLAGDIAGSNAKLGTYNQRDGEVVALARALPASVRDPIVAAYDALTGDAVDRYYEARERARAAGERVQDLAEGQETSGRQ